MAKPYNHAAEELKFKKKIDAASNSSTPLYVKKQDCITYNPAYN